MTAIKCEIFPNAEQWLKENMEDLEVDSVCAIQRKESYDPAGTEYRDYEEGTKKTLDEKDHVKALQLLCDQIGKTLHVGGITSPLQLEDTGNWDVEVVDAFFQLIYHGEVIYG